MPPGAKKEITRCREEKPHAYITRRRERSRRREREEEEKKVAFISFPFKALSHPAYSSRQQQRCGVGSTVYFNFIVAPSRNKAVLEHSFAPVDTQYKERY